MSAGALVLDPPRCPSPGRGRGPLVQAPRRVSARLAALACALGLLAGCRGRGGPPYTAAESLKTVRLEPGFRIEPFLTEPAIASPVAMAFDETGRLFVVEMPGYPLDTRPTGRVKLLEDRDHDGRYKKVTVFADGLVLPTGVMRWKRGILVTAAPDVWYFEDTDGDGRADVRKVVLTGFAFTNPQHTVNGPLYGLDNWIYLAHEGPAEAIVFKEKFGDRGSGVRFPDQAGAAASRWRPWRADPSSATPSTTGGTTSPSTTPTTPATR